MYLLKEYKLDQQLVAQGRFKTYTPPDFTGKVSDKTQFAHNMVSLTRDSELDSRCDLFP